MTASIWADVNRQQLRTAACTACNGSGAVIRQGVWVQCFPCAGTGKAQPR